MSIPGRRAVRWLKSRVKRWMAWQPRILLYHRVADAPSDPYRLAVSPERFGEHLELLRRRYRPMALADLARALRDGRVPARAVAVTFDDGYADNLHNAKPLLERHGVPATVFVTTGHIGSAEEFWWDEIERLLLAPGRRPADLVLTLGGAAHRYNLGDAVLYPPEEARRHRAWSVGARTDPTERHRVLRDVHALIRPLDELRRRDALLQLRAWASSDGNRRASHRTMSPDEVVRLATGGLIAVGAHSVTHPVLSALTAKDQADEIERSKASLEGLLGAPVTSFAYPFGDTSDYTADTARLVAQAGFTEACANVFGVVHGRTDPFHLPRIYVGNWDGDALERRLVAA